MESTQSTAANFEVFFETLESQFRQFKGDLISRAKCRLLVELANVHAKVGDAYSGSHHWWVASKMFVGYSLR